MERARIYERKVNGGVMSVMGVNILSGFEVEVKCRLHGRVHILKWSQRLSSPRLGENLPKQPQTKYTGKFYLLPRLFVRMCGRGRHSVKVKLMYFIAYFRSFFEVVCVYQTFYGLSFSDRVTG